MRGVSPFLSGVAKMQQNVFLPQHFVFAALTFRFFGEWFVFSQRK